MTKKLELRHSTGPYIGALVLYVLILFFLIIMSATHSTLTLNKLVEPIVVLATIFLIFTGVLSFINSRYLIFTDGDALVMKSVSLFDSSKTLTSIKLSDITSIRKEMSDVNTAAQLRRPFRRIAIYSDDSFIDVSLKHFKTGDVRKLMDEIRSRRPDLVVPYV